MAEETTMNAPSISSRLWSLPGNRAEAGMVAYRVLRSLLRLATSVFFRQVEVFGLDQVPARGEGPVLFVGNHPNSLIDPVLIVVSTSRIVRFAAKDTLFRVPVLRSILRMMGAVPLARRSDHPDASLDNSASFEKLSGVLAAGGAIGIFPEGVSHDASQLQRVKTGAARIALGVAAQHAEVRLRIVPCGLTYVHRKRFRSRALVQFGEPIAITRQWVLEARLDEQAAVRRLTEAVEGSLRALTVNAEDWQTVKFLDGVRRLFQPPAISLRERVELARRFNLVYPRVKNDPEVVELQERVAGYLERLRRTRLRDRDLRRRIGTPEILGKITRHLLFVLAWLPLAVPGFVVHAPVGLFAVYSSRWLMPRKDVLATTKFVGGMVGCMLLYAALLLAVLETQGWLWTVGVAAALPITGLATLIVIDRGASMRAHAATLIRLLSLRREVEDLQRERAVLETAVVNAVCRLRPPDMQPLFPNDARIQGQL